MWVDNNYKILKGYGAYMISVGIDVSKEKSTVCIMKPYGEVIKSPYEILHTEEDVKKLIALIKCFSEETRVVMEATGAYHLPLVTALYEEGIFVSVINPLIMKKYSTLNLRKGKTDKIDSIKISNYGLDNWFHLECYKPTDEIYSTLKLLGRQYFHYMRIRIESLLSVTNILDMTMPRIKTLLKSNTADFEKDKLLDFAEKYWHFDNITIMSEEEFILDYNSWTKTKGYQQSDKKAQKIYSLAKAGITTLSSKVPTTQILVMEAVRVLKEINKTLNIILSQMEELSKGLNEYSVVKEMNGVGEKLAVRLIAEIGDIHKYKNSKSLVAYAGIDAPPYQSGKFTGTNRHITKRGSALLRKTGYEVMKCLKTIKPENDSVYLFMIKKEQEGKPKKVAKIAALNKFLRIYYAKVKELY